MRSFRKALGVLALLLTLSACTPAQVYQVRTWMDDHSPACTVKHHAFPCKPSGDNEPTITEDSPWWNCHVDGNRICGR